MSTHPLWRPFEIPTQEEIDAARTRPHAKVPIEVVAPDPAWGTTYELVRSAIVGALGERVIAIEHVGSTSVPDLWAKPYLDIDLIVADSSEESAYLPDLEAAGFELLVREPEWEEHRCLKLRDPSTNLHVFSPGAVEPRRHVAFRDWLRAHAEDREAYASVKREVAAQGFTDGMLFNNAKAWVVYDIYERIFAADPAHPHTPRPREG